MESSKMFVEILIITTILHSFIVILVAIIGLRRPDPEKNSSYECGFQPFPFTESLDISFFSTGISFLIFDVELILMLAWITNPIWGGAIFIFFLLLIVTLIIEIWEGMLDWENVE